jgi:rod shape-determining protein MreD
MILLLIGLASTVAALLETTVVPYLRVGQSQPHLVFVFAIIVTVAAGFERGLVWGFVGGLVLDVLAQRPLGSTAFALLLAVGGAAVLGQGLSRLRPIAPIIVTFVLSGLYTMTLFLTYGALRGPLPVNDFGGLVMPGAVYDVIVAALFGPFLVSVVDRRTAAERVEW